MKKIPTLYLRNPNNLRYVTREPNPTCQWVLDGEGTPTLKHDGICVLLDHGGWWARREVKPGRQAPENYQPIETDPVTGKTVGWEPIEQSSFVKYFNEAFENNPRHDGVYGGYRLGTYELVGPKINGNPEQRHHHALIRHAEAIQLTDVPRDYDGLATYLADLDWEGIVWHHEDGRMAKLKRRDIPAGEV